MSRFIAPALLVVTGLAAQAFAQSPNRDASSAGETSRAGSRSGASASDDASSSSPASGTTTRSQDASGNVSARDGSRSGVAGDSPSGSTRSSQSAGSQGQPAQLEQAIAAHLLLGNQEEIAISQFGQDRAQNPQVKQFAQMMVQEHQQAVQQLQQASPQLASMNLNLGGAAGNAASRASEAGAGSRSAASGTPATASTTGQTPGAGTASANQRTSASGDHQLLQFARDVKQQCLELSMQELGRKQGAEFDKAFMGQQVALHTGMLAHLRAAQQHAQGGQLQPIIQKGTEMTEHHLAQARQIMEQLDAAGSGTPGAAANPATPPSPRTN